MMKFVPSIETMANSLAMTLGRPTSEILFIYRKRLEQRREEMLREAGRK